MDYIYSNLLLKKTCYSSAITIKKKRLIAEKSLLFSIFCRTSCSIYLAPFNLGETEEFLKKVKQIEMNRHQILELYMILGGIPYYLDMLRKDLLLTKNIDNLFFK